MQKHMYLTGHTISEYVNQIIVDEGNVDSNVEKGGKRRVDVRC